MKKYFGKAFLVLMTLTMIAVIVLTGCEKNSQNLSSAGSGTDSGEVNITKMGEGDTSFLLEVTDDKGDLSKFLISTDEKTVGAALVNIGLIVGDNFGMYVVVNGIKADYDADKAYWAFYVDGKYAMTGMDSTEIEVGKTYALVYTKG